MIKKGYFQLTDAIVPVFLAIVMFTAAGCVSVSASHVSMSAGSSEGIHFFSEKHLVARGFTIRWETPVDGTAYLVEEKTGKILQTETLRKGQVFTYDASRGPLGLEKMVGLKPAEAKISLYFVPCQEATSAK